MSRSHDDVTVLKLGSSVLTGEEALPRAVHAVYAELRRGRRVVVVVSTAGEAIPSVSFFFPPSYWAVGGLGLRPRRVA